MDAQPISLSAEQVAEILKRPGDATTILAINVSPAPDAPVACLVASERCKACETAELRCSRHGQRIDDAYRFPRRNIEGTTFMNPIEIARLMNATERRALLDLSRIPLETQITVWFDPADGTQRKWRPCKIVKLDADELTVRIESMYSEDNRATDIPLRFVRVCWRSEGKWNVQFEGHAFDYEPPHSRSAYAPPGGSWH